MAGPYDLTGQNIENTYQRVLQTPDGTTFYDGTGSLVNIAATAVAGGSNTQVQFNSASVFSGSSNFSFDYVNNNVLLTGSLLVTQSHISTVDYIDFNPTVANPGFLTGRLHWTDDTKTLQIDTDINNFEIELGHQNVVRGRNVTGYTLTKGMIVYINGESGNRPTFTTASWEGDPSSASTLGFVAQDINDSQTGYVVTNGILRGLNTNAYAPGTQLYLSSSGQYTSTIPISPNHEVRLGKTITQATNGYIYVDIMNGYELGELHDVLIVSKSAGDLLMWNSGSKVWVNTKTLSGSYSLSGSLTTNDGLSVQSLTASFISASNITGSLFGTASYATNALSASYVPVFPYTGSAIITGSLALTGSFNALVTGSDFVNIGNATTASQRLVRIGQDTSWVDFGSLVGSTSNAAIFFNQNTPSTLNSAMYGNANGTVLNATGTVTISLNITPIITISAFGTTTINPLSSLSGATTGLTFTVASNTNQTATTNIPNFLIKGANKQWATGAITNQYWNYLTANTASFVGASTITSSYGLFVEAANAGTNATITNNYAAGFSGSVLIKDGASPAIEFRSRVTAPTTNAIYMHGATPTVNNFNFAATSTALLMNVTPGGTILIQTGTSTQISLTNTTQTYSAPSAIAGGAYQSFIFNKGNHANQTASTPIVGINWNLGTRQWATGDITTQKEFELTTPTYSFVGPSTITSSYTMFVNAPVAGTNATITNNYAAGFSGSVYISNGLVLGTTSSAFIGSGQVYASNGFLSNTNSSLAGIIGYTSNLGLYGKFGNSAVTIGHNGGATTVMSIYTASMSYTGSAFFTGSLEVTGSINASSFTGSLLGTASYASQALTASYAESSSYAITTISASYATTASYINGNITKANNVVAGAFGGTPLTASITFTTAFPNTNYSIVITGEDARTFTVQNKLAGGFEINTNSSVALTGDTYWQAISYGEFNS